MRLIDKINFVEERQCFIAEWNDTKMIHKREKNFLLVFSVLKILIILAQQTASRKDGCYYLYYIILV